MLSEACQRVNSNPQLKPEMEKNKYIRGQISNALESNFTELTGTVEMITELAKQFHQESCDIYDALSLDSFEDITKTIPEINPNNPEEKCDLLEKIIFQNTEISTLLTKRENRKLKDMRVLLFREIDNGYSINETLDKLSADSADATECIGDITKEIKQIMDVAKYYDVFPKCSQLTECNEGSCVCDIGFAASNTAKQVFCKIDAPDALVDTVCLLAQDITLMKRNNRKKARKSNNL